MIIWVKTAMASNWPPKMITLLGMSQTQGSLQSLPWWIDLESLWRSAIVPMQHVDTSHEQAMLESSLL